MTTTATVGAVVVFCAFSEGYAHIQMQSSDTTDLTLKLLWAGRVWGNLTRIQCAGVLHIALRYGERQADTNAFIESMSMLPWAGLGHPLQVDVMKAFVELHLAFGR